MRTRTSEHGLLSLVVPFSFLLPFMRAHCVHAPSSSESAMGIVAFQSCIDREGVSSNCLNSDRSSCYDLSVPGSCFDLTRHCTRRVCLTWCTSHFVAFAQTESEIAQ